MRSAAAPAATSPGMTKRHNGDRHEVAWPRGSPALRTEQRDAELDELARITSVDVEDARRTIRERRPAPTRFLDATNVKD